MSGTLYVVATPIGNLEDLTSRAQETLRQVDLVACEDTRRTGRLLNRLGIENRLLSLHEHNEDRRTARILEELESGQNVALVSDAGTPLLSDPGYLVVRAATDRGYRVTPIPGASAILVALVASGLPPYPFTFVGFPPAKSGRRRRFFARFRDLGHTVVFFESPHRLLRSLADASEVFGSRPAAIGRELTKLHEEMLRGDLRELHQDLAQRKTLKGEFCVVLGGAPTAPSASEDPPPNAG